MSATKWTRVSISNLSEPCVAWDMCLAMSKAHDVMPDASLLAEVVAAGLHDLAQPLTKTQWCIESAAMRISGAGQLQTEISEALGSPSGSSLHSPPRRPGKFGRLGRATRTRSQHHQSDVVIYHLPARSRFTTAGRENGRSAQRVEFLLATARRRALIEHAKRFAPFDAASKGEFELGAAAEERSAFGRDRGPIGGSTNRLRFRRAAVLVDGIH